MNLRDKVVMVTGGSNGIGAAMCRRFAAEGAREVAILDVESSAGLELASEIHGSFFCANVESEAEIQAAVDAVIVKHGRVDLFCSNAGIVVSGGCDVPNRDWLRIWEVNVMAHVFAARAVLPGMLARGDGYLLQTISAAGLLSSFSSAPYAVTKHAALGFAEWLSITYGDYGLKVSALCPQGVRTRMLENVEGTPSAFLLEGALEPGQVADAVIRGLAEEHFLILPHAEVAEYFRRKASDYDRWLSGMRRLKAETEPAKTKQ